MPNCVKLAALLIASCCYCCGCGGGGQPLIDPFSGIIRGRIDILGPVDPAADLRVSLAAADTGQETEFVSLGRMTSNATAFLDERTVEFHFSRILISSYFIQLSDQRFSPLLQVFRSADIRLGFEQTQAVITGNFSFTGPSPFGSAAGHITMTGSRNPAAKLFLGWRQASPGAALLVWPESELTVNADGSIDFLVDGLSYGSYELGLYQELDGSASALGNYAEEIQIAPASPDITGVDFEGDYGAQ